MKLRNPLKLAFFLIVVAALVVFFSFVPAALLSSAVILAIAILSLSIGLVVYLPVSASRDANIGLLGPSGVAGVAFVITSSGVLAASLFLEPVKAFALSFVNLTFIVITWAVLRFSAGRIVSETARSARSSNRRVLSMRVKRLSVNARESKTQLELQRIAEEISHTSDGYFEKPSKFLEEMEIIIEKIEVLKLDSEEAEWSSLIRSLETSLYSLKIESDSARL